MSKEAKSKKAKSTAPAGAATVPAGATTHYGFSPKGLMHTSAGTFRKGDLTGIFLTIPEGISIASAMRMLRTGLLKPELIEVPE